MPFKSIEHELSHQNPRKKRNSLRNLFCFALLRESVPLPPSIEKKIVFPLHIFGRFERNILLWESDNVGMRGKKEEL